MLLLNYSFFSLRPARKKNAQRDLADRVPFLYDEFTICEACLSRVTPNSKRRGRGADIPKKSERKRRDLQCLSDGERSASNR